MARTIRTETVIDAAPERVWDVLVDFAAHAEWDPFLVAIEGAPRVGERLGVTFHNGWTMRPTVTRVEPGRVFEWFGKLAWGGLFDGRHRFELIPEGGRTRLVHGEEFSGVLVPFTGRMLADTEKQFGRFNDAIRARAEA